MKKVTVDEDKEISEDILALKRKRPVAIEEGTTEGTLKALKIILDSLPEETPSDIRQDFI